jgi:hypothetical protein
MKVCGIVQTIGHRRSGEGSGNGDNGDANQARYPNGTAGALYFLLSNQAVTISIQSLGTETVSPLFTVSRAASFIKAVYSFG